MTEITHELAMKKARTARFRLYCDEAKKKEARITRNELDCLQLYQNKTKKPMKYCMLEFRWRLKDKTTEQLEFKLGQLLLRCALFFTAHFPDGWQNRLSLRQ